MADIIYLLFWKGGFHGDIQVYKPRIIGVCRIDSGYSCGLAGSTLGDLTWLWSSIGDFPATFDRIKWDSIHLLVKIGEYWYPLVN
jgi:hypothetical protein